MLKIRAFAAGIVQGFEDFFTSPGKDQFSPYDQSVHNIVEGIGVSVGSGVTRAINGSIGGTMKQAGRELEAQAVAENPNLALMGMMPKSIQKNPLAMIAMQQIMNRGGVGGGVNGGNSGSTSSGNNQSAFDI